ncbi:MAG TPA: hypothetical protein VN524_18285 [Hyphomicrobiaceae bacterium]|jgi:hypothetical protein|nr:hypothetical protein [Hyphomicrobiaceae bacterium]
MIGDLLCPPVLRRTPQVGCLDLLAHATEIAIIALCAAHPAVEHELGDDALPGDQLADRIIDRAMTLLDAVDRYRLLLHDPHALHGPPEGQPF